MSECKPESPLGPGGLIRDEVLLREIKRTKPLPPADILKLAKFYMAYETNHPLGDHLALVALTQIVGTPSIKKGVEQLVAKSSVAAGRIPQSAADFWDGLEDLDSAQEAIEKGDDSPWAAQIRLLPASRGLSYLVETPSYNRHEEAKHYMIGVSTDPTSQPE